MFNDSIELNPISDHFDSMNSEKKILLPDEIGENFKKIFMHFFGKLYATPNLTRIHVQDMFNNCDELVNEFCLAIKSITYQNYNNDCDSCNETRKNIVSALDAVKSTLGSFSSEFKRFKIFNETNCLIYAKDQVVGDIVDNKFT